MKPLAFNPYLPGWEYIPDGEPHVFDGRVYVYGSHDAPGGNSYCLGDYVCWSTPVDDLGAWHYEGVIFRKEDAPQSSQNILSSMSLAAPDVCQGPDGRYYLYYAIGGFEGLGVAVCDTPAGHFQQLDWIRLPDGRALSSDSGYGMMFDPAVYVEDHRVWLYYGFGVDFRKEYDAAAYGVNAPESKPMPLGGYVAELQPDMVTIIGEPRFLVPGPEAAKGTPYEAHPFFEASSMRKISERYYFVYSSKQGHELCYGIAASPDAPPVFGGVIISNGDVGLPGHETEDKAVNYLGNNHGGLEQIGDQVYIFYHRHTHGAQYSRQGCAEPVSIRPDGSIPQVEITSCGLNGSPLPAKGEYSAHIACALHGTAGIKHFSRRVTRTEEDAAITQEKDASPTSDNQYIENLRPGSGCGFKYFAFTGKERLVRLELRGTLEGTVTVHLDREDGSIAARVPAVPSERWQSTEAALTVSAGRHAVYLTFEGTGACDFNAIAFS